MGAVPVLIGLVLQRPVQRNLAVAGAVEQRVAAAVSAPAGGCTAARHAWLGTVSEEAAVQVEPGVADTNNLILPLRTLNI